MALFRKHNEFARLVAVVVTGTFLSACMTWQTQSLEPERFRTADSTQTVRLTLTSGDTIMVHGPVITGDSLVGMKERAATSADSLELVSIPLTGISQAEMKKNDPGANALVVVLAVVASVALVAASHPCYALCGSK